MEVINLIFLLLNEITNYNDLQYIFDILSRYHILSDMYFICDLFEFDIRGVAF